MIIETNGGQGEPIIIKAGESGSGKLIAMNLSIVHNQGVELYSAGSMNLNGSTIDVGNSKDAIADLKDENATLYVEDLNIISASKKELQYTPNVNVIGNPYSGDVVELQ